ncbi:urease accessory protein UreD [Euhalothece natronophila Z-M001]|uniref:Urease accessory protein UreD n=1 Tax=Euhalothece natronophila Z-M001 TaxID=522448 RepID=A0A5B8NK34_9CHRO|nr:urease accessory protein UreD [Euhalothece natronophila]QDZ39612.1 urease accessory protein UreD [Euhalothece natronophila Z-M001]
MTLHLQLKVGQDAQGYSQAMRTYATYPFRLSPPLMLSSQDRRCLYLYLMNTAPGWLAGDGCFGEITLAKNSHLFLTDQAATKVHTMPNLEESAQLTHCVTLAEGAFLEWLPEPIILYQDACFQQKSEITIADNSGFAISEILIPGRLARGESYQFRHYSNQFIVKNQQGKCLFQDSGQLFGKKNPLRKSHLLTALPIMGTLYLVPPKAITLSVLQEKLQILVKDYGKDLKVGVSTLPNCEGLLIRLLASHASDSLHYIKEAVSLFRHFLGLPTLPEIPK